MFGKKDEPTKEALTKRLKDIQDPILEKGLAALGMVGDIQISASTVRVEILLPTPGWAAKSDLAARIEAALKGAIGDRKVDFAWSSKVMSARATAAADDLIPGAKNIILFASGKGGVGKSTIASNVASALAAMGARVGLLDADIYGPSIPTMFGTNEPPEIIAEIKKIRPLDVYGLKLMSIGFAVDPTQAMAWRGPMLNGAVVQFMRDVDWGDLDYLCLDMPPGTGDVQLTIAQNIKVSGAVLVSTPQDVALADVIRAKAMFDKVQIPILGVVENMSSFVCGECKTVHNIFSKGGAGRLANELGLPVLGEVPIESSTCESGDSGKPEVLRNPDSEVSKAILKIAQGLATDLAKRGAAMEAGTAGSARRRLKIVQ